VSSTIPLVLEKLIDDDALSAGKRLAMLGFGVGYSWAGCTLEWA
jgi:3-oxoacyl-[acyl-carrier-protein] synthase-3